MPSLGAPELIIIFFIVLILFGVGKLADVGKSLGQGIREFRKATSESEPKPAPPAGEGFCPSCGTAHPPEQRFCSSCGAALTALDSRGPRSESPG